MTTHTDPKTLPCDVVAKILAARDALTHYEATDVGMRDAIAEAYHQLYAIADPDFCELHPWVALESHNTEMEHDADQATASERRSCATR